MGKVNSFFKLLTFAALIAGFILLNDAWNNGAFSIDQIYKFYDDSASKDPGLYSAQKFVLANAVIRGAGSNLVHLEKTLHETFSECTGTIFLQLILSNIVGGSIAFWFVSHVRPSKKVGISSYKILRPFNDLMSSAPLLHGTVFRLLPIPFRPIINFLLGITNITFSQYVKTAALASLFETMTWEAIKGIVHQIQDSKYRVSQSLIAQRCV